ncbi:hypothetical protein Tco_1504226, partial [Tanacetum coccineum]
SCIPNSFIELEITNADMRLAIADIHFKNISLAREMLLHPDIDARNKSKLRHLMDRFLQHVRFTTEATIIGTAATKAWGAAAAPSTLKCSTNVATSTRRCTIGKIHRIKGPILEDGPNFKMTFRLFHGQNGVVLLFEPSSSHILHKARLRAETHWEDMKDHRKCRVKHEFLQKQNEELKNEIYQLQTDRCKSIFRNEQTKSQLEEKTIKRDEDVRNLQKLLAEKECASQELKCKRVDDSKRKESRLILHSSSTASESQSQFSIAATFELCI